MPYITLANATGVLNLTAYNEGESVNVGATTDTTNFTSLIGLKKNEDGSYTSTESFFTMNLECICCVRCLGDTLIVRNASDGEVLTSVKSEVDQLYNDIILNFDIETLIESRYYNDYGYDIEYVYDGDVLEKVVIKSIVEKPTYPNTNLENTIELTELDSEEVSLYNKIGENYVFKKTLKKRGDKHE